MSFCIDLLYYLHIAEIARHEKNSVFRGAFREPLREVFHEAFREASCEALREVFREASCETFREALQENQQGSCKKSQSPKSADPSGVERVRTSPAYSLREASRVTFRAPTNTQAELHNNRGGATRAARRIQTRSDVSAPSLHLSTSAAVDNRHL